MENVRPWCGQPSDRRRLKNRTETRTQTRYSENVSFDDCGLFILFIIVYIYVLCRYILVNKAVHFWSRSGSHIYQRQCSRLTRRVRELN